MGKEKTRKSATARFKITKRGKLLHRSQQLRHLRSQKGKRRIRSLKQMKQVVGVFKVKLERMMGRK